MRIKLAALFIATLLLASCGKKEDQPQTQVPPKDTVKTEQQTQQQQQQQTQQKTDTTQQKQSDVKKEDDKTKDADKKKDDDKKKDADKETGDSKDKDATLKQDDNKQPLSSADIDFSLIWPKKCAKCHGKDGRGKIEDAPDLTSAKIKAKSEAELFKIISNGIKAKNPDDDDMPAWKGKLSDDEIKAAAKYVKGL